MVLSRSMLGTVRAILFKAGAEIMSGAGPGPHTRGRLFPATTPLHHPGLLNPRTAIAVHGLGPATLTLSVDGTVRPRRPCQSCAADVAIVSVPLSGADMMMHALLASATPMRGTRSTC
eukprot:1086765-Rhodomonas_salina.1